MNVENLMENVRDFFAEKFKGMEETESFISFEPLGTVIDPLDFQSENEEIAQLKATEQLSVMGDRLPEINPIYFTTTSRLSDVYEELIESAEFSGVNITSEDKSKYLAKFAEVKSEVKFKFNEADKASISTPEGTYLPVYGSPKKWFDPNGSFWMKKSFSAKKPVQPQKKDGNGKNKDFFFPLMWRTNLETSLKSIKKNETLKTTKDLRKKKVFNRVNQPVFMNPILFKNPAISSVGKSNISNKKHLSRPIFSAKAKPISVSKIDRRNLKTSNAKTTKNIVLKDLNMLKHLDVSERIRFTNMMTLNSTAPIEPVNSDGFSMSFDYCIVNLNRPWFDSSLFHYRKLWYSLTHEQGYFSSGTNDESNDGVLKSIPTAMILIKNLKISAAWSDKDKENAKTSVGLGIFNVNDSVLKGNDLVNPGIQIIGWVCEVMPRLPELDDPNILPDLNT